MRRSTWPRRCVLGAVLALAAACTGAEDIGDEVDTGEEQAPVDADEPEDANGTLHLGYVLPQAGASAMGLPQIAAVEMAVEDVNAAGGVLAGDVTLTGEDEGTDPDEASAAAERLVGEGVDAIIGAASSEASRAMVDMVTSAGIVQCSGSNTAPDLSEGEYQELYFRTAPSAALQGPALAERLIGDGNRSPAIVVRDDAYGRGLSAAMVGALAAHDAQPAAEIAYDPRMANFDAVVEQVVHSNADSVVLIASEEEGATILTTLIAGGFGPANVGVYGTDRLASEELPDLVDPDDASVLDGMRGTAPAGSDASASFLERVRDATGSADVAYAAEAYDCVTILALAAELAGSDDAEAVAAEMVGVTSSGEACENFAECKEVIAAGGEIEYRTMSGVVLTSTAAGNGEPASGRFDVWEFDGAGSLRILETVRSSL